RMGRSRTCTGKHDQLRQCSDESARGRQAGRLDEAVPDAGRGTLRWRRWSGSGRFSRRDGTLERKGRRTRADHRLEARRRDDAAVVSVSTNCEVLRRWRNRRCEKLRLRRSMSRRLPNGSTGNDGAEKIKSEIRNWTNPAPQIRNSKS